MRLVATLLALAAVGCATPIDPKSYPWATASDECSVVAITGVNPHDGYVRLPPPEARAIGHVRTTDGRPITKTDYLDVWFGNRDGAQEAFFYGDEFNVCIGARAIRGEGGSHVFTATLRASKDGPVLYRSPAPQKFEPDTPIVVLIAPVGP